MNPESPKTTEIAEVPPTLPSAADESRFFYLAGLRIGPADLRRVVSGDGYGDAARGAGDGREVFGRPSEKRHGALDLEPPIVGHPIDALGREGRLAAQRGGNPRRVWGGALCRAI
jgi:hypothetical protein